MTVRLVVVALLTLGCGDDDATADAGPADAAPDAGATGVTAPALPSFECPAGWRAVTEGDVTTCDPWPDTGYADCGVDEGHFPGEPGCVRVGTACPAGEYPEGLPTDRPVVYVNEAGMGGSGTIGDPYGSVRTASLRAPAGAVIAVGKGTFRENMQLSDGTTVWGACVAETFLEGLPTVMNGVVVRSMGAGVEARNLRIGGDGRHFGAFAADDAELALVDVIIDGAGIGGAQIARGSTLDATNVVIRNTLHAPDDLTIGRGLQVFEAATAVLRRAVIETSTLNGVFVADPGCMATFTDVAVRTTLPRFFDRIEGNGIVGDAMAVIELERVAVEENRTTGIGMIGGSSITARDLVVRDTLEAESMPVLGIGFVIQSGGTARLERVWLQRNTDVGLVANLGSTLEATDVVIRDTRPVGPAMEFGLGLDVFESTATITRLLVERSTLMGIWMLGPGAVLVAEDVAVRDTLPGPLGIGRALDVGRGSTATVNRGLLDGTVDTAIVVHDGGTLDFTDLHAVDVESRTTDGLIGSAMQVFGGSMVSGTRGLFERSRSVGVSTFHAGTTVSLTEVAVREVRERACAETTCVDMGGGVGVGAFAHAAVTVTDFEIADAALCGVMVARGGTMDLLSGEVARNPIGACVQTDGFDPARLSNDVAYVDNGVSIDSTSLPVPEPTTPPPARP